jgi:hypothetical protein
MGESAAEKISANSDYDLGVSARGGACGTDV